LIKLSPSTVSIRSLAPSRSVLVRRILPTAVLGATLIFGFSTSLPVVSNPGPLRATMPIYTPRLMPTPSMPLPALQFVNNTLQQLISHRPAQANRSATFTAPRVSLFGYRGDLFSLSSTAGSKASGCTHTFQQIDLAGPAGDAALHPASMFSMPVESTRVSSPFGIRIHPLSGLRLLHRGVDLAAATGTPVAAAADGTVSFVGTEPGGRGYGKFIIISHPGNYLTYYAHLSAFSQGLKAGATVKQGQYIGDVGMTGAASGPHLHFEIRRNQRALNPLVTLAQVPLPTASPTRLAAFKQQTRAPLQFASIQQKTSAAPTCNNALASFFPANPHYATS